MLFVGSDVKVSWKCQSLVHVLSAYHDKYIWNQVCSEVNQDGTGEYVDLLI